MLAVVLAVIALLIFLNALYVAAEFATVSSRRARVAELASEDHPAARALLPVLESRVLLDRYIAACQVGITLSSLLVGYYGQAQLTPILAPLVRRLGFSEGAAGSVTVTVLLLLLTFLQVIFGELLPKSVALRFPERLAVLVVHPMRWSLILLRPLIAVLNGSALLILRRFGMTSMEESHVHHPDELEAVFRESAEGGLIDAGERDMLAGVFDLSQRLVRQIMVPRTRMIAAPAGASPAELIRELAATPHTRFPVYDESIDRIRGAVHLRDLHRLASREPEGDLSSIVQPIPLVPEFLTVTDVWSRMRREGSTMAAVFDEHGGVVGIVTDEDILEELFGELQDEFDEEPDLISEESDGRVVVRGDMLVVDVNERFGLGLPEEPADTIGGLVMDRLERVALEGDSGEVAGVEFEVVAVENQAVSAVRLGPGLEDSERGGVE